MSYDENFYKDLNSTAYESAKIIIPALLSRYPSSSLLDVGCGSGLWVKFASECGLASIGIDHPQVEPSLVIPRAQIALCDLNEHLPPGFLIKFDIALCLEVVEHLTEAAGAALVPWLCRNAETVVFSAAIPGQRGEQHVNEQWPSYWIPLFNKEGRYPDGWIRRRLWNDKRIPFWYRQNILVFPRPGSLIENSFIQDCVHPDLWHAREQG